MPGDSLSNTVACLRHGRRSAFWLNLGIALVGVGPALEPISVACRHSFPVTPPTPRVAGA